MNGRKKRNGPFNAGFHFIHNHSLLFIDQYRLATKFLFFSLSLSFSMTGGRCMSHTRRQSIKRAKKHICM